jgi:hypothetical protein
VTCAEQCDTVSLNENSSAERSTRGIGHSARGDVRDPFRPTRTTEMQCKHCPGKHRDRYIGNQVGNSTSAARTVSTKLGPRIGSLHEETAVQLLTADCVLIDRIHLPCSKTHPTTTPPVSTTPHHSSFSSLHCVVFMSEAYDDSIEQYDTGRGAAT